MVRKKRLKTCRPCSGESLPEDRWGDSVQGLRGPPWNQVGEQKGRSSWKEGKTQGARQMGPSGENPIERGREQRPWKKEVASVFS